MGTLRGPTYVIRLTALPVCRPKEDREQVVGVKMAVWQTEAEETLCALSSRLPAMSDRSWNPQAGRSYVDFQSRVGHTTSLLAKLLPAAPPAPPPKPLPGPAAPGFEGETGACRDKDGKFANRLEHMGPILLADCQAVCALQGAKCDAYDWQPSWCGIWGTWFTAADNVTSVHGPSFGFATGSGDPSQHVCKGDPSAGDDNFCYHRTSLSCSGGAKCGGHGGQCLPGCSAATCGL